MTNPINRNKAPTASRILMASASVAAGIGLVGLLSAQGQTPNQELVIQVTPAPVIIKAAEPGTATTAQAAQPAIEVVESTEPATATVEIVQTQPAQAEPVTTPDPVTESTGS